MKRYIYIGMGDLCISMINIVDKVCMNSKVSFVVTTRVPKMLAHVRYHSVVTSHLLAILLLDSQNSSLSSQPLSVHFCTKSARVKPWIDLQITSSEYKAYSTMHRWTSIL